VVSAIHDIDGRPAILTNSRWRHNFAGSREIEVVRAGQRRAMKATLEADPDKVAEVYAQMIDRLGVEAAPRRLGISIGGKQAPTHAQLVDLVKREGLSVVYLDSLPSVD
jgi:hypothetical protein